ncbi:MAG: YheC/YheD family protein [Candidatus Polarisedimenticolia bacterium]
MRHVGFHYGCPLTGSPWRRLSPSVINRVALMDAQLRKAGMRLLVYSPGHIIPGEHQVPGYLFEDGRFVATRATIPDVNGNWTNRTRRLLESGMGYHAFARWAEARHLGIYVPHAFSELVGNKLETYKLVRGFHATLHPHCEPYEQSDRQLEYFIENGRVTFIKPRAGNQGNRIVTVRNDASGLTVTHYRDGQRRRYEAKTLRAAAEFVRMLTEGRKRYLIQHGVEALRYDGSVFDIRVVMLHDGLTWSWVHEVRLSTAGSDVSNVRQGGKILLTEDLLIDLLGGEAAQQLMYELKSESFGLTAYLERLHPGEILEVAFDFALDHEARLRLLEINTKPGLSGIGSEVTVYDKRPEDEPLFEHWVYPHVAPLARFLLAKVESRGQ